MTPTSVAPPAASLPPRWQAGGRWAALALALAALAILGWKCFFDLHVRFLSPGPGQWITYPQPPELGTFTKSDLSGTFRRAFAMEKVPANAVLAWRSLADGEVRINNTVVVPENAGSQNWKTIQRAQVASLLRAGTNEILATAINDRGLPAFSLKFAADGFAFETDASWDASVAGSNIKKAVLAGSTPQLSDLDLFETTAGAWRRKWPWIAVFAAAAAGALALGRFVFGGGQRASKSILLVSGAAWVVLLAHNIPFVPAVSGFDADSHLAYVNYIFQNHRLPPAAAGAEMYHPPLYYLVAAASLRWAHWPAFSADGLMLLRSLNIVMGAGTLAGVFIGLRLLFPGDWRKPAVGFVVAAFLPAQLYLLHYTTNENLCTLFVTAAVCLGIYLLRNERPRWTWNALLGVILGLAFLSKSSALLAIVAILGARVLQLVARRERTAREWLWAIAAPLAICLGVAGWHYWQLWREYGSPFIASWSPRMGGTWWQIKGFQTLDYYFSFGQSLSRPFFSGLHSFWDGIYSTLWGDGLAGGRLDFWSRPPWNYDFMAMGFTLALAPSFLVLTGLARALASIYRAAELPWIMLLGLAFLLVLAVIDVTLTVPSYSHSKAFFALSGLMTLAALAGLGFEFWSLRSRVTHWIFCIALGAWMLNVFASFWILPDTIPAQLSSALAQVRYVNNDDTDAFARILEEDPGNVRATLVWASQKSRNNPDAALARLEEAARKHPAEAELEANLALALAGKGRMDEAIVDAKHAAGLAPDSPHVFATWSQLALRQKNYADAETAARAAVGLNPTDNTSRFCLAWSLLNLGKFDQSEIQFAALVEARPDWADAHYGLAMSLLNLRGRQGEGLSQLKEAVRLNPQRKDWQDTLARVVQGR